MARRKDRPAGPLDPRSQAILRAIIEEYVTTASRSAARRWSSGTGSASARPRSATSWLSSRTAGYLTHPHTSAGRVPNRCRLPPVRRVDRAPDQPRAGGAADDPPPVRPGRVRQRAVVPTRRGDASPASTHAAGLATPAKPRAVPAAPRRSRRHQHPHGQPGARPCRGLGQAGAHPARRAVRPGRPRRRRPRCSTPSWAAAQRAPGREPHGAAAPRSPTSPALTLRPRERIERMMRDFDAASVEDVFSDGLLNVMAAPEFSQSEKLRRVFGVLAEPRLPGPPGRPRVAAGGRPGADRRARTDRARCRTSRWCWPPTGSPAARWASWACSVRRAWHTRRRSAPSATSAA